MPGPLSQPLWFKMKSPDNKFEIQKIDYIEIRMGSPLFGQLEIIGSPIDLKERSFGEPMCFSPDSKYLAVQELLSGITPITKLLLIELETGREIKVRQLSRGFLNPVYWTNNSELQFESVTYSINGSKKNRFVYKIGEP